ncbi:MAG TPA: CorA family divalent cation transporter [Gaiellaceae bacterium]|nr:CorA family divalent cation transporter [Gaiellaceae bacterium]
MPASAGTEHAATNAILFDRDRIEHLEMLADRPRKLSGSTLLWVDVHQGALIDADEVAEAFDLDKKTRKYLEMPNKKPVFDDHGRYIHITTYAPREDDHGDLHAVECVVGENWVITAHDRPIAVLDDFATRVSGSGDTGSLDGPSFLAALLEWVLGSYTAAFERIEQRLEDFDVHAMRGEGAEDDIERLVEMRKEVGMLRRALAAHRSALVALTHPELEALGDNASGERFRSLFARFESTLQEARDAREAIVGSFDVLIARGGHHTNQIMKILTLTSVILLPGTLIAGLMGMNFRVELFSYTWLFWVVLATIFAIATLALGFAKYRDWI